MKKMLKIASVLAALVMLLAFLGCGDDSEDMTPNYYTVTFDANGGEGSMTVQKFTVGEAQSLQANAFTRTDYNFTGWNTKRDGSGTDYADEAIVKNLATINEATVTLYAHWIPNDDTNKDNDYITQYYTVTFNSNNGTPVDLQTVANRTMATEPIDPTLDGYIFDGWYYGNTLFDFSTPITKNITLYAHWTYIGSASDIPPNEDNDNTDNDEKPQYVWLPVDHSHYSSNSNVKGTQEWVYYNKVLDYKYIDEFQSETQTEQNTVIQTTAYTNISTERCSSTNSVTTTYIYDSDGNEISNLLYQSETVTTYFEEVLPRILVKSTYQKSTSNDGNVFENNTDYSLEYIGEENDCKVYKHLLNNGTSYTIYKIKDNMIQEQDYYYDDKLNSITKYSVSGDEFLAELEFQDSINYDANGNLISTSKHILNSKNENEASIDLVTSSTTYESVNSYKYKRFTYPFSN